MDNDRTSETICLVSENLPRNDLRDAYQCTGRQHANDTSMSLVGLSVKVSNYSELDSGVLEKKTVEGTSKD
jgi:hypothetical protein